MSDQNILTTVNFLGPFSPCFGYTKVTGSCSLTAELYNGISTGQEQTFQYKDNSCTDKHISCDKARSLTQKHNQGRLLPSMKEKWEQKQRNKWISYFYCPPLPPPTPPPNCIQLHSRVINSSSFSPRRSHSKALI